MREEAGECCDPRNRIEIFKLFLSISRDLTEKFFNDYLEDNPHSIEVLQNKIAPNFKIAFTEALNEGIICDDKNPIMEEQLNNQPHSKFSDKISQKSCSSYMQL